MDNLSTNTKKESVGDYSVPSRRRTKSSSTCGTSGTGGEIPMDKSDPSQPLIVDQVHIFPGELIFEDAYEGKEYNKQFSIQNRGPKSARVQFRRPTARAFHMKPLSHFTIVSPGMKITRNIRYKYRQALEVRTATIIININDKEIVYYLKVILSAPLLIAKPTKVDLGIMDVGTVGIESYVILSNVGKRSTQFSIDMGTIETEVTVTAEDFYVEAESSIRIKIEVMGFRAGPLEKEFWIKSQPPIRITVFGTFRMPKLTSLHPSRYSDFTMIHFFPIYSGMVRSKILLVKNDSASDIMYCFLQYKQVKLFNEDDDRGSNKFFTVIPQQGLLPAQKTAIFQILFHPTNSAIAEYSAGQKHIVTFMELKKVEVFTMGNLLITGDIEPTEQENFKTAFKTRTLSDSFEELKINDSVNCEELFYKEGSFVICLYGDYETAQIIAQPNTIDLNELQIGETAIREISLTNFSQNLSINYEYVKALYTFITPAKGHLKPKECKQVLLKVTPSQGGIFSYKIVINLVNICDVYPGEQEVVVVGKVEILINYTVPHNERVKRKPRFVQGITPIIHNEVGVYLPDGVPFNTKLELPRNAIVNKDTKVFARDNTAIIAFPSDMPKAVRPWRVTTPCLTIFAKLPRIVVSRDEFTLTAAESAARIKNRHHWNNYVKTHYVKHPKLKHCGDMPQTMPKIKCQNPQKVLLENYEIMEGDYIPLTALQIYKIEIKPKFIKLQKIAPMSSALDNFVINNRNEFPIHVMFTTKRVGVTFPHGNHKMVKAHEKITVLLKCSPGNSPKYMNEVDVIINYNHVTKVSIMAEAVPKSAELDIKDVCFDLSEATIKYVELKNPLNSSISVVWEIPVSRFTVAPKTAVIPPKRNMYCMLKYKTMAGAKDSAEAVLTSEGGTAQLINISHKKITPTVVVSGIKDLKLGNVPLNLPIRKSFMLKNFSNYDVCFEIVSDAKELVVYPKKGIIERMCNIEIIVTIHKKTLAEFRHVLNISIEDNLVKHVVVFNGNVVYPLVTIRPETLILRKMMPHCYKCVPFNVKNTTECPILIKFNIGHICEYSITENSDRGSTKLHNRNIKYLPKELKTFYLHLIPTEASVISFYIPIVINDMIGPPILSTLNSADANFYVDMSKVEEHVSRRLPLFKYISVVLQETVEFSTFLLNFVSSNRSEGKFVTVTNICNHDVEICIRIDELLGNSMFHFKRWKGANIQHHRLSIVILLKPKETCTFIGHFNPEIYGEFQVDLPIYLRNYQDGAMFNYIRLKGKFPRPKIICACDVICFEILPLSIKSSKDIVLKMNGHRSDCLLAYFGAGMGIEVQIPDKVLWKKGEINVSILFMATKPRTIRDEILFECTCDATCTVKIHAMAENSILLNHAFFESNFEFYKDKLERASTILLGVGKERSNRASFASIIKNSSAESLLHMMAQYMDYVNTNILPTFPTQDDQSVYAKHQRATLHVIENWVFTQGFYGKGKFKIPSTLAMEVIEPRSMVQDSNKHKMGTYKTNVVEPYLVTLLINLRGPVIRTDIVTTRPDRDIPVDVAYHYFTCYQNLLKYLEVHGCHLVRIEPEYFLKYDHYLIIYEFLPEKLQTAELIPKDLFISLSTQAYMDCILSYIKMFVLLQISTGSGIIERMKSSITLVEREDNSSNPLSAEASTYSAILAPVLDNLHTKQEIQLMNWLQFNFDKMKVELWSKEKIGFAAVGKKDITSFGPCLKDCLAFATVIAGYCPYTQSYFEDMYLNPESNEEFIHNACKLCNMFNKLNFSYVITPTSLIECNCVNMLLLTMYLHEILPHMTPGKTIHFDAKLTQSLKVPFVIMNNEETPMMYRVIFFNNEWDTFSTPNEYIKIGHRSKVSVHIMYVAKKIIQTSTILILSGECQGQKYARTIVLNLKGTPDTDYAVREIEVKAVFYKVYKLNFKICPPYEQPDTYELFYNVRRGYLDKNNAIYSWKKYIDCNLPQRLYSEKHIFTVTEPREGLVFEPVVCCTFPEVRIYTLYMIGTHGDWSIRIVTIPKIDKKINEVINISLPVDFNETKCLCPQKGPFSLVCPRTINVEIPCRNNLFWKAVRDTLDMRIHDESNNFWKKYIGSKAGYFILKEYLKNAEPDIAKINGFGDNLSQRVDFVLSMLERDPTFSTLRKITIHDVHDEAPYKLPIHANNDVDPKNPCYIKFESPKDKRYYRLYFSF